MRVDELPLRVGLANHSQNGLFKLSLCLGGGCGRMD